MAAGRKLGQRPVKTRWFEGEFENSRMENLARGLARQRGLNAVDARNMAAHLVRSAKKRARGKRGPRANRLAD